jgi:large subunit ribosomal protein L28
MGMQCDICGKGPSKGNTVTQRGKAKYLGGNGRKTTGISRRMFRPNLQRIRVQEEGQAVRRRVCTSCLRSGKVQKAVVRKPFTLPAGS